jgi:hypothetical protein
MSNPWLKKNPFMSAWLSAFNSAAGAMRGHAIGQAKRQAKTATTNATKTIFDAWLGSTTPVPTKKKRRRR